VNITDLQVGQEIHGYMRTGLALEVGITGAGEPYRFVPDRQQRASPNALTRFYGLVMNNHTDIGVLSLSVVSMNHKGLPNNRDNALQVDISYGALHRVFVLSSINYTPRLENRKGGSEFKPTSSGYGTGYHPYRTREQVLINW
jgi:hypothetical protein